MERDSDLIIPKSLIKTEPRPKITKNFEAQAKSNWEFEWCEKKIPKVKKVKTQREKWNAIEEYREVVKEWKRKKPRKPKEVGKKLQKRLSKKKPPKRPSQNVKR